LFASASAQIFPDVCPHRRGAGVVDVGLVPDLPLGHAILVALDERAAPLVPGRQRLGRGRKAAAQPGVTAAGVDRVAVVELQPRTQALGHGIVDDGVEPVPRVDALGLLALGPARLEPDALGAERPEILLEVVVDREVAVDGLGADRPRRGGDVLGRARRDLAEHGQVDAGRRRDFLRRALGGEKQCTGEGDAAEVGARIWFHEE
jgi:hypothetical protein